MEPERDIQRERRELADPIYLIPDYNGEYGDWMWCDDPAPSDDHDPTDAVKFNREHPFDLPDEINEIIDIDKIEQGIELGRLTHEDVFAAMMVHIRAYQLALEIEQKHHCHNIKRAAEINQKASEDLLYEAGKVLEKIKVYLGIHITLTPS
ncbi:MAG: hypothetical protein GY928_00340 [Colwellia sp.]|nr:hypothetical protein [Colwellia sp.]